MKYWVYINNEIKGPFEKDEILKVEGFNNSTLVCPQSPVEDETKEWKEASSFPELIVSGQTANSITGQESMPDVLALDANFKKEDIMIERFNVNNIFSPSIDSGESQLSSADPLSLSQIRKREEVISQRIIPERKDEEKKREFIKNDVENKTTKPDIIKSENSGPNLSLNISLPDTDSILNSNPRSDELDQVKPYEVTELKKEIDEVKSEVVELKNELPEEIKPVIKEFKTDAKISEEKKDSDDCPVLLSDSSGLKAELIKYMDMKISSLADSGVSKEEFYLFKEEIKKYISEKLSSVPTVTSSDIINHLDIEVRDIKVKLEALEKSIADLNKTKEQSLEREIVGKNSGKPSDMPSDLSKTMVVKKDDLSKKERKPINVTRIFKPIVYLVLFVFVIVSVGFALKQFGIFDFTKFISIPMHQKTEVKQELPRGPVNIATASSVDMVGVSTPSQINQPIDLDSGPQTENLQPKENINQSQNQYDIIIDEVRGYKINTNKTLENSVTDVVRARKGDLSSIKWLCDKADSSYLITINAVAGSKEILLKFDYDPKTKILKPLNTLSVNTLKMMMKPEFQPRAKSHVVNKKTDKNILKTLDKEPKNELTQSSEQTQKTDEQPKDEDEYLIIGE